jgi:hypothetical protein
VPMRSVKAESTLNHKLRRGSMKLCTGSARSAQFLSGEKSLKKTCARCVSGLHLDEVLRKSQRGRMQGAHRDIFEKNLSTCSLHSSSLRLPQHFERKECVEIFSKRISKSKTFQRFKGCKECTIGLKPRGTKSQKR